VEMKRIVMVAIVIFLVLSISGFSCKGKIENFEISEPTEIQLAQLEKIYQELGKLQYIEESDIKVKWESKYKEKFNELCGGETGPFFLKADYYQNPKETLKRNGGDCEDFAILFVSAAKSLGVSARVVEGEIFNPKENEFKGHNWSEIYYRNKWQIVDPILSLKGVSFWHLIENPEDYPQNNIFRRYDEKILIGKSSLEIINSQKPKWEKKYFQMFYEEFKTKRGIEPDEKELEEIKQITKSFLEDDHQFTLLHFPKDPRIFIQPAAPKLNAWVEKIKAGG